MAWQHGGPLSGSGPPWGTGSPPWGSGGPGWWSNGGGQTSIETHTVVATQTVTNGRATVETTRTQIVTRYPTVSPSLSSPNSSPTSLSVSSIGSTATILSSDPNSSIPSHSSDTPSTPTTSQTQHTILSSLASNHALSNSAPVTTTTGSVVAAAASVSSSGTDVQFTSTSHPSHGAFIGGVIGGILIFMLLGVLAVFTIRRRRRQTSVSLRDAEQALAIQPRHDSGLTASQAISKSGYGATINISTADISQVPEVTPGQQSMSPTSTRPLTETFPFPLANNNGYSYLDRRTTKLMREKERYRISENLLLRSDSTNTSGHGHSVESSADLLANSAPPGSDTAVNTGEELLQLRAEVGLLRAREAERSWERRDGDEEVLPAYESGPPHARQPRHEP